MKLENFKLLKKLSEVAGAPGFEKPVRDIIISELEGLVDKITVDNMGNVTAFRKGNSNKKVMIAAHMDEIGFIVNHIDENGFLRFSPLGGFDPKTAVSMRVTVHGKKDLTGVIGAKPIHLMTAEERGKSVKLSDFFIDLGMKKKKVDKYVEVGNPITRQSKLINMGNCVNGKSLDNRISVFILIETLKQIKEKELPFDTYAVFTVQEEVGLRGVQAATLQIQPDFAFALDTTIAYDTPGAPSHQNITKLGNGAAIKVMDAGVISDYRMVRYMKKVATENSIKFQPELMLGGGTDAAKMQQMTSNGAITGAVSIPTRHIHQVIESVHKSDIRSAIDLLDNCICKLDNFDSEF